ncbi:MAG: right-handed parallel beta-helix repeat-containing protein [Planctomycetota bacterium]
MRCLTTLPVAVAALLPTAALGQTTWFVDDDAVAPGSGTQIDPYASLQFAIDQMATLPGDTIEVAAGTYAGPIDLRGKSLLVVATEGRALTEIDAMGLGPVVRAATGEGPGTTLEGFTLRNGVGLSLTSEVTAGGGLFCDGVEMTVRACLIVDCTAPTGIASGVGGGIYANASTLFLDATTIERTPEGGALHAVGCQVDIASSVIADNTRFNIAFLGGASGLNLIDCTTTVVGSEIRANGTASPFFESGGGVFAQGGLLMMESCSISENRNEGPGGGLALIDVTADLAHCVLDDNEAFDQYSGGGIYFTSAIDSSLGLTDCALRGNHGGEGGGVFVGSGSATLLRCVVDDNDVEALYSESGYGGGVFVGASATASLTDCTLAGNVARGHVLFGPGLGGGVYGATAVTRCTLVSNAALATVGIPDGGGAGASTLDCCIVWDNAPNAVEVTTVATASCIEGGWPGLGNFDSDPRLWSIPERDLHLLPGSPCIDACDPFDAGAIPFDPFHCGAGCDGPQGSSPCASNPNSTGGVAKLSGLGSATAEDNLLILVGEQLPPGALGYMLGSETPGLVPLFGGSEGVLCLGGTILRFSQTVLVADVNGIVALQPDLSALPGGNIVTAGETWYFQSWFRDAVGGVPTSNTTTALEVTFL